MMGCVNIVDICGGKVMELVCNEGIYCVVEVK